MSSGADGDAIGGRYSRQILFEPIGRETPPPQRT